MVAPILYFFCNGAYSASNLSRHMSEYCVDETMGFTKPTDGVPGGGQFLLKVFSRCPCARVVAKEDDRQNTHVGLLADGSDEVVFRRDLVSLLDLLS
jgi:hypothetical protein